MHVWGISGSSWTEARLGSGTFTHYWGPREDGGKDQVWDVLGVIRPSPVGQRSRALIMGPKNEPRPHVGHLHRHTAARPGLSALVGIPKLPPPVGSFPPFVAPGERSIPPLPAGHRKQARSRLTNTSIRARRALCPQLSRVALW